MICAETYSHRYGQEEAAEIGVEAFARSLVTSDAIKVRKKSTKQIREHIRLGLTRGGWTGKARVKQQYNLTVSSLSAQAAFQIQTGNIARVMYDLLKLQALFMDGRIRVAIIAVPTTAASRKLGSNYASFSRVRNELSLFNHIITVPIFLLGIE